MTTLRPWGAAVFALALLFAIPAAGQVRQLETVGAYPLEAGGKRKASARDVAVKMALNAAVLRVATDLVTGVKPSDAAGFLPGLLGKEPLDYISRYRIIEDRGERARMYSQNPNVEFEYVVLVESHIDSGRVKGVLAKAGLLVTRPRAATRQLLIVIDQAYDFAAYETLRTTLLERLRVKSAIPIEMERGRIVLAVETSRNAGQVLEHLLRKAPSELAVTPIDSQDGVLTVRVRLEEPPETPAATTRGASRASSPTRD